MNPDPEQRIAIIIGSTRPGRHGDVVDVPRKGEAVGRWVLDHASETALRPLRNRTAELTGKGP
jgi:hypothetical protein